MQSVDELRIRIAHGPTPRRAQAHILHLLSDELVGRHMGRVKLWVLTAQIRATMVNAVLIVLDLDRLVALPPAYFC
jgi:hypothetical protein